jgi:hypothetical protein
MPAVKINRDQRGAVNERKKKCTKENQGGRSAVVRKRVRDLLVEATKLVDAKVVGVDAGVCRESVGHSTAHRRKQAPRLFMQLNGICRRELLR